MAKNIVQLNIDGTSYTQRPYGTCSTAANIAAKVVTCSDFNLVTGTTVMVKFTYANTVANPTLNVNSKGAKAIYYRGSALTASSLANWGAGDVVEFRYNGTQWDLLNVGNTDTDTKVTSVGNHYTPAENTSAAITATGGDDTNITNSTGTSGKLNVVTGLKRDAKGHVVGVTCANIYASGGADGNYYHTPTYSSGLSIATGTGVNALYVPIAGAQSLGAVRGFHRTSGTASGTKTTNASNNPAINSRTTTSERYYGVETDKDGYMFVNVPWESDTNTTYTFAGGTNGFTVTPSGGSAQTVTVTPSISNNVTYSGTLTTDQVAVFNGTGGQIKASGYTIAKSVPSSAVFTDTKVTQTVTSSNANYPILLAPSGQTATTTTTSYFASGLTYNPSLNALNLNKSGAIGGVINFGDKEGDEGFVYIKEHESDRLCLAADLGITLKTGFINEGGDIILDIWPDGDDRAAIRPYSNGTTVRQVDIGRTAQRFYDGYFSNQVYAANGFYESSDERLKDFGEGLKVDLDALSKLRKSYFTFKDKPEDSQIGVSAQEIQKLYPEVVIETSDGHLNVDYAKLSVVALAAIDQLNDKVKSLEDRLARLEQLLENK